MDLPLAAPFTQQAERASQKWEASGQGKKEEATSNRSKEAIARG
jgi:hypothetical protein